jgi:signal transduction histidine kinase
LALLDIRFVGNALGNLTLGAAILAWSEKTSPVDLSTRARRVEALALLISLPVVCLIAFKTNFLTMGSHLPAFLYLPMPLVLWAAVRFGTRGASAAILVVILASISGALDVPTVFMGADAETNVLGLQLFLVALSAPMLLLGAAIEDSRRAEQAALDLAQLVLGAHDHERRFVAHSLHDSIAQDLAAASFVVERIKGSKDRASIAQLENALQKSMADLRALSYQLHPPLLDSAGLEPALRTRLETYCRCTGIEVDLEVTNSRLPPDVELTIFRLVEDALANVKDNPGSSRARVSVTAPPDQAGVVLIIEDAFKGMAGTRVFRKIQEILSTGVGPSLGLVRMRQRLQRIGGRLEVRSMAGGTFVRAMIPVPADRQPSAK